MSETSIAKEVDSDAAVMKLREEQKRWKSVYSRFGVEMDNELMGEKLFKPDGVPSSVDPDGMPLVSIEREDKAGHISSKVTSVVESSDSTKEREEQIQHLKKVMTHFIT